MDDSQSLVSWLALFLLFVVAFTVYGSNLKAILFTPPATVNPNTGGSGSGNIGTGIGQLEPTGYPFLPYIWTPSMAVNVFNIGGAFEPAPVTIESTHTTLASLGVILLVTIILVEVAGVNKAAAGIVGLLFLGVLLIYGMTHTGELQELSQYPKAP